MTLEYEFGSKPGVFEYDLDYSEIMDYFESLTDNDLVELMMDAWDKMSKDEQLNILYEMNSPQGPQFDQWVEDDREWCIETFAYDHLEDYEDELHDFYEDKAYRKYRDNGGEPYDEYEAIGMGPSDFR